MLSFSIVKLKYKKSWLITFIVILIMISVNVNSSTGAIVIDGKEPNRIKVSDYCPKTSYCEEGSHVICMYYNPNRVAGPDCFSFMNQSITSEIALKILDIINGIRAKVAQGKETGMDGMFLPRGYGLMRLQWDSELATFAQVMANQCHRKPDICRSTSRFPDPGQNYAVSRMSRSWAISVKKDDIFRVVDQEKLKTEGLNNEKLLYGVYKSLEYWYNAKKNANASLLTNYPDFRKHFDKKPDIERYARMVTGAATHIGCGLSAYSSFTYVNKTVSRKSRNTDNSIRLICNISAKPKTGRSVYEMEQPSQVGYTIRCGCPPGYEEDDECLCYESPASPPESSCDEFNKNCKPAVVLLPIVTADDEEVDIGRQGHVLPSSYLSQAAVDKDIFGNYEDGVNAIDHDSVTYLPTVPYVEVQKHRIRGVKKRFFNKKPDTVDQTLRHAIGRLGHDKGRLGHEEIGLRRHEDIRLGHKRGYAKKTRTEEDRMTLERVQNEDDEKIKYNDNILYDDKRRKLDKTHQNNDKDTNNGDENAVFEGRRRKLDAQSQRSVKEDPYKNTSTEIPGDHPPVKRVSRKSPHYAKGSLFSRTPKFELPSNSYSQKKGFKPDVSPRKDFSNTKLLLDKYIKRRKDNDLFNFNPVNVKHTLLSEDNNDHYAHPSEDLNKYLKNKFNYQGMNDFNNNEIKPVEIKTSTEDSDNKLMNLLDTLEREVNHIELNMNEKEIFDAKLRKIYDHVIGKPENTITSKTMTDANAEISDDTYRKDDYARYETAVNNHLANEYDEPVRNNNLPKTRPQKSLSSKLKYHDQPPTFNSIENDIRQRPYKSTHDKVIKNNRRNMEEPVYKSRMQNPFDFKNKYEETENFRQSENKNKLAYPYERKLGNNYFRDNEQTRGIRHNFNIENNMKAQDHIKSDILDTDRRKYYQEKLERLERKLHAVRGFRDRNEHQRARERRLTRNSYRPIKN